MRFVIYRNSVLATICSMFGAAFIAMAVMSMVNGELGILPGIGVTAAGIGLMCLAGIISDRKEKKKQAKAAAKAAASNASASGTVYAQPKQTAYTAQPATAYPSADPVMKGKPAKKCAVFAGIFFLLAGALGFWMCKSTSVEGVWRSMLNSEQVMACAMGLLMVIAAFRTKHIQEVSVLFLLGYLGLALGSLDVTLCTYRDYGFGGYSTASSIHYMVIFAPMLRLAAYALMMVFSLFSMRKIKKHLGGIVKALWWIPMLALAVAYVKWADENFVIRLFTKLFQQRWRGLANIPREILEAIVHPMLLLATVFSSFCFQRICRNTAAVSRPEAAYAQPAPQYTAPVQPAPQPQPVQPQPAPQSAPQPQPAPVKPQPAAGRAADPEIQKKVQAYKDLLECGILSQEEYDQKIREMMR